ncbi:hypothetical protein BC628DRAFT_576437 [Trametes gibbosa]|nr:hypothetical protein BC628DRAFT_576437 [Trametes gibbosa]
MRRSSAVRMCPDCEYSDVQPWPGSDRSSVCKMSNWSRPSCKVVEKTTSNRSTLTTHADANGSRGGAVTAKVCSAWQYFECYVQLVQAKYRSTAAAPTTISACPGPRFISAAATHIHPPQSRGTSARVLVDRSWYSSISLWSCTLPPPSRRHAGLMSLC